MSIIKDLNRVIVDIEELQDLYAKADANRLMAELQRDDLRQALEAVRDCQDLGDAAQGIIRKALAESGDAGPAASLGSWSSDICPTCRQHKDVMGMPCNDQFHLNATLPADDAAAQPQGDDAAVERVRAMMYEVKDGGILMLRADDRRAVCSMTDQITALRAQLADERSDNRRLKVELGVETAVAKANSDKRIAVEQERDNLRARLAEVRRDFDNAISIVEQEYPAEDDRHRLATAMRKRWFP